ncbi:hypothetical protein HYDPIDRAFT_101305 [Hydnomerulius pinastri MD-312]|uniref:HAT C-terminal dimerisation domain-containing protein n=1 Tax=Hydnomerulius pinastri MD-312 TaxID=994086 RepID=A0A0C9W8Q7_9AGAM|nr:hypothetical protein HYDPIDRAFT_101305 [Hydnomerulius pinastri MD-312]
MAWGGAKEQRKECEAGNANTKDWHNEALKVVERTMEEYWNDINTTTTTTSSRAVTASPTKDVNGRSASISPTKHNDKQVLDGWKAELRRYLDNIPTDVSKDTNIVAWWVVHSNIYLTLSRIAKDVCVIPATSVPCERLFSAGAEIATDRRSCLGMERFEQLQVLKHAWQDKIVDVAQQNSSSVGEVYLDEFQELLKWDNELAEWDSNIDEVVAM